MQIKHAMFAAATSIAATVSIPAFANELAAGEASFQICKTCHGQVGEGNLALNAPAIAGLQGWYLERQLNHYKSGVRGSDAKDIYGSQMRPMSMTLADDSAVKSVVAYMKTLPTPAPKATIGGDAAKGKALYVVCSTCHGQKAEGMLPLNAPALKTQHDWYLVRQIKAFKSGIRGKHPKDIYGQQMVPMSMTLANDEAIKNVVAYITSLK